MSTGGVPIAQWRAWNFLRFSKAKRYLSENINEGLICNQAVVGGQNMKKRLFVGAFMLAAASFGGFAGDVAAFVDLGLSSDGTTYVFGEYGKTDKKFQGYAEIYAVDIASNSFVDGGVFKTVPSSSTASKSGKSVFEDLQGKASWYLKKYNLKQVSPKNLLYVCDETKSPMSEIVFKDFDGSTSEKSVFYHIQLSKNVEGSGKNVSSSFYITMERKDEGGNVLGRNMVGSPDVKRKGVAEYKIDRIFSDDMRKNLIFVVEKTVKDDSGTSIRYMVETVKL